MLKWFKGLCRVVPMHEYTSVRDERDCWKKLYQQERKNNGGLFLENERIKAVLADQLRKDQ